MTWKWIVLVMLAVLAGSWVGYLTMKALNGLCYEIEIMRSYLTGEDE